MQNYELTFLVSSELSEEEINKITEEISSFLQKENGAITQLEKPVPKTLAYSINKQKEAYLVVLTFYLEPEKIKNLNQKLKGIKKILRFTVITKRPEKKFPASKGGQESTVKESVPKKFTASSLEAVKEKDGRRQDEKLKEIEKKLDEILGK